MTLIVKIPFHITTTKNGQVWAKEGDKLIVQEKNANEYYIKRLNDTPIFSRWMKQNFVKSYCNEKENN